MAGSPTAPRQPPPPTAPDPAETPVERTRLAWRRTTLAGSVIGLLGLRFAVTGRLSSLHLVTAALIAAGWLGLVTVAHRRIQSLNHRPLPGIGSGARLLSIIVGGFAAAGLVLVLW